MKKIFGSLIFVIIALSLLSSTVTAESNNILFYGKDLGKIENSLKVDHSITKTQTIPQNLSSYKVIAIISPDKGIFPTDNARLLEHVNAGGSLIIIAEDFTEASVTTQLNRLLAPVSIEFNVDRLYDDNNFFTYNNNVLIDGDSTFLPSKGVSRILYVNGCTLKGDFDGYLRGSLTAYSKNYDLFEIYKKGDRPPVSAFINYGKGKIILVGDRTLFEDTYVIQGDNALFVMNLFDFASERYDSISERVEYKEKYDQAASSFLSDFNSKKGEGFSELKPSETNQITLLIQKGNDSYLFGLYKDAYTNISQAISKFESEINVLNTEFNQKLQGAKKLEVDARNKGISAADEAIFNEGVYYLTQAEKETNLTKRIELLDSAIQILQDFGEGDRQRAKVELDTAENKLNESKKTLFYESDVQKAEEYLNEAKKLFNQGNYPDAVSKATESQTYSDRAIEKYNILKIVLGLGLLLGALLLLIITKRIFSWKKQKET